MLDKSLRGAEIRIPNTVFSSPDHESSHIQGLEQQAVRLTFLRYAVQILQIYLKTRDDRFFP